jgi:hypothetical protein
MPEIVHARCPNCKQTLRIPAGWVNAALKCKHCGLMFKAKGERAPAIVAAPPAPPPQRNGEKIAQPQVPVRNARPTNGAILESLSAIQDDALKPSDIGKGPKVRKRSYLGVAALLIGVGLFFVAGALVIGAVVILPMLKKDRTASASSSSSSDGSSGKSSKSSPARPRITRSGRVTPIDQHTSLKDEFPNRRALVISINNYLYMNPTLFGSTKDGAAPRGVSTLMDRFRTGLRIKRDQMALVSDAAPNNPIKPSKKAIEDALSSFLTGVREQDCLVLVIIGHVVDAAPAEGQPDEPCLVPLDGVASKSETLIPVSAILHQVELSSARQKLVIFDTCRFNPARGFDFPASGPPDSDTPGVMWEKLDQQLAQPPEGVQVWSSCLKDQFSHEFDADLNDGVFIYALEQALSKIANRIQYPEELLPVAELVDPVNETIKELLQKHGGAEKRVQTSRLAGSYFEGGLTYDEGDEATKPLPKLTVTDPSNTGGAANVNDLKRILMDMKMPPIRLKDKSAPRDPVQPIEVQMLPFIAAEDLKEYLSAADSTPASYRKVIDKARADLLALPALEEELAALVPPKTDKQFDAEVEARQRATAKRISKLEDLLKEMELEDKASRANASKRGRADFDYTKSRVQAQLIYSYEVNSALGAARKKETPNLNKDLQQNGWRMIANPKPQGDKAGKDVAKARMKLLQKMEEDYKGTPWEVVARREEFVALGIEWQAVQLGK